MILQVVFTAHLNREPWLFKYIREQPRASGPPSSRFPALKHCSPVCSPIPVGLFSQRYLFFPSFPHHSEHKMTEIPSSSWDRNCF